ncbi:MAG: IS66 family insertion sequence element accessory protein TnpB [Lentisphaeria bacterium]|nr:MAG: IS66 family insertion sequence element accessory protein TnpB [Lentisphaeria bacterium]
MFGFSGTIKFYYCPTPISMRKSFDGLAGAVEEYIQQEPESGHAFVFFGRSRKMVKILQWQGRWLYDLDEALGKRCLSPSQIGGRAD